MKPAGKPIWCLGIATALVGLISCDAALGLSDYRDRDTNNPDAASSDAAASSMDGTMTDASSEGDSTSASDSGGGPDSSTGADAGPFPTYDASIDVGSIAAVVAWFDGEYGVVLDDGGSGGSPGTVLAWFDHSSTHNDLTLAASGSANGIRPDLKAFHGHDAVKFDGANVLRNGAPSAIDWGADDYAFLAVVRPTSCALANCFFVATATAGGVQSALAGAVDGGEYDPFGEFSGASVAATSGVSFSTLHVVSLWRNGIGLRVAVDGVEVMVDAGSVGNVAGGAALVLGGNAVGSAKAYTQGDIAEAILLKGPGPGDVPQLEKYLMVRYGLTP